MPVRAEEEAWTTIVTTNTRTAKDPAQANPEAGQALVALLPARDGADPPPNDPIDKAAHKATVARHIKGNPADTSAAQHLPAALRKDNTAAMSAPVHRQAEAALRRDSMAAMSAALLLPEAALPAPHGLRPLPVQLGLRRPLVPAGAGDIAPPVVLPTDPRNGRRNAVIASAYSRERSSFFRLHWSSSR